MVEYFYEQMQIIANYNALAQLHHQSPPSFNAMDGIWNGSKSGYDGDGNLALESKEALQHCRSVGMGKVHLISCNSK